MILLIVKNHILIPSHKGIAAIQTGGFKCSRFCRSSRGSSWAFPFSENLMTTTERSTSVPPLTTSSGTMSPESRTADGVVRVNCPSKSSATDAGPRTNGSSSPSEITRHLRHTTPQVNICGASFFKILFTFQKI